MRYEIRPLGQWIGPTTALRRSSSAFRAPWSSTLELLGKETELLGANLVVLQVDVVAGDIRRDGMLRAGAKVDFPGVRVSFDSMHGPLTYASDTYEQEWHWMMPGWQANIRAIALALEALRAVDRYGVSKRGEQYRGWTALEAEPHTGMTVEQAAEFMAAHAGADFISADVFGSREWRAKAFRAAARKLHPDYGGDPEQFRRLTAARALLDGRDG